MWSRLRLDIGWNDLARGFLGSLVPGGRAATLKKLEAWWSKGKNDTLACLSVRSGLDLLLEALDLPQGSEVLFSALTVPDMPRIALAHGLVPVPVDLGQRSFSIDTDRLRRAITGQSRVLVVAHLFGARPDMHEVLDIARAHDLYVVEDCAQAWHGGNWRGNEQTDASLFSFGVIKTATCLGGAMCRVGDPGILERMRDIQSRVPVRPNHVLLSRIPKYAGLKAISSKPVFGWVAWLGRKMGRSIDDLIGESTKGFRGNELLPQIRQQPATGTLRMLLRRLPAYDTGRIGRRVENARRISARLGVEKSPVGLADGRHSCWLFPFVTRKAEELIPFLQLHGFDSTRRGSLVVVPPPAGRPELNCPVATGLLDQTVFLPCYCEMTDEAIDEMCELILSH